MNDTLKKEAEALRIPYEKMGRVLVWHDEFAGDGIDPEKWCFYRTMSAADREYDNSERCIRVEDGQLHMQVHRSQQPGANFALSEGFTTKDTMNFKYGYLELRARGAVPSWGVAVLLDEERHPLCQEQLYGRDRHLRGFFQPEGCGGQPAQVGQRQACDAAGRRGQSEPRLYL